MTHVECTKRNLTMQATKTATSDILINKICYSLFIFAVSLSHEFLHKKIFEALPSLYTVHRIVSKTLEEGVLF